MNVTDDDNAACNSNDEKVWNAAVALVGKRSRSASGSASAADDDDAALAWTPRRDENADAMDDDDMVGELQLILRAANAPARSVDAALGAALQRLAAQPALVRTPTLRLLYMLRAQCPGEPLAQLAQVVQPPTGESAAPLRRWLAKVANTAHNSDRQSPPNKRQRSIADEHSDDAMLAWLRAASPEALRDLAAELSDEESATAPNVRKTLLADFSLTHLIEQRKKATTGATQATGASQQALQDTVDEINAAQRREELRQRLALLAPALKARAGAGGDTAALQATCNELLDLLDDAEGANVREAREQLALHERTSMSSDAFVALLRVLASASRAALSFAATSAVMEHIVAARVAALSATAHSRRLVDALTKLLDAHKHAALSSLIVPLLASDSDAVELAVRLCTSLDAAAVNELLQHLLARNDSGWSSKLFGAVQALVDREESPLSDDMCAALCQKLHTLADAHQSDAKFASLLYRLVLKYDVKPHRAILIDVAQKCSKSFMARAAAKKLKSM